MKALTPVKLRVILSLSLVALLVAGIGLFMVGYGKLKTFATTTQDISAKAQASQSTVRDLTATEKFLKQNSDAVERASLLVSESTQYVYQDQIIKDINKYATDAGLQVTTISFAAPTTVAVGAAAPNGVKSMTATVALKNPANYVSMLNFIHYIEKSLFRMQISQVSMSASSDDPNKVTSDILTIEVYVR